jgi:hypothetical protein
MKDLFSGAFKRMIFFDPTVAIPGWGNFMQKKSKAPSNEAASASLPRLNEYLSIEEFHDLMYSFQSVAY